MTVDKKKKAAIAAVMQYLETERLQVAAAGTTGRITAIPDPNLVHAVRPWGISGRSAYMQTRTMMYYRALR